MPSFPMVTALSMGSALGGGRPGIYAVNFDPTVAGNAPLLKNMESGSLLIQYGALDANCVQTCVVGLFQLECRDCDDPVVVTPAGSALLRAGAVLGAGAAIKAAGEEEPPPPEPEIDEPVTLSRGRSRSN